MSSETLFHDKTYELKALEVISPTGIGTDVFALMVELNLFEDIYAPTMSGELMLVDTNDLISALAMQGNETLRIIFSKAGEKPIVKSYRIYKIDGIDINYSNQAEMTYIMKFCSEEALISAGAIVSKSYKGKSVKDIVNDILRSFLGVVRDNMLIDDTPGTYDLIVPYISPFEAINWVIGRSAPPAIFFENKRGYVLSSIQKLITSPSVANYSYAPQNAPLTGENGVLNIPSTEEVNINMFNMISFQFYSVFDTLDGLQNGLFASSLETLDILRQKEANYVYNYNENFEKLKHVDSKGGSFDNDSEDRTKKTLSEKSSAVRRYYPTNLEHNTDTVISQFQPGIKPSLVENWMLQRISQIEQLNYFRVKFVAPGNIGINVGNVIDFAMPRIKSKTDNDSFKHPYYSGRYFITAIRHKFTLNAYEMVMEGVKDCTVHDHPPVVTK